MLPARYRAHQSAQQRLDLSVVYSFITYMALSYEYPKNTQWPWLAERRNARVTTKRTRQRQRVVLATRYGAHHGAQQRLDHLRHQYVFVAPVTGLTVVVASPGVQRAKGYKNIRKSCWMAAAFISPPPPSRPLRSR